MKKSTLIVPLMSLLALMSCGRHTDIYSQHWLTENRTYVHELVTSQRCKQIHTQDPIFNCGPSITFLQTGKSQILVTDIVNTGTYSMGNKQLRYFRSGPGDVPNPMVFGLSDDENEITDNWFNWTWKIRPNSI